MKVKMLQKVKNWKPNDEVTDAQEDHQTLRAWLMKGVAEPVDREAKQAAPAALPEAPEVDRQVKKATKK